MHSRIRAALLTACTLLAMTLVTACHKNEHEKVRVHEETRHGDVQEERPGEMVVE